MGCIAWCTPCRLNMKAKIILVLALLMIFGTFNVLAEEPVYSVTLAQTGDNIDYHYTLSVGTSNDVSNPNKDQDIVLRGNKKQEISLRYNPGFVYNFKLTAQSSDETYNITLHATGDANVCIIENQAGEKVEIMDFSYPIPKGESGQTGSSSNGGFVQTGDDFDIYLIGVVGLLAVAGITVFGFKRKKE